ncbi:acetolactate decarboxylase [Chitinophaga sp. Cy-1792]|uniref:acetolactate decarboxylase n=1 Tax=Chitinophaga sp. Cy-1792 TaxID=2608339 RepID=UPI001423E4BD|nr:acetolactate decarboxylase [Chitinophaga sp. Cy-1792]NIG54395.1 acetolactate decarboxylase [Chitinophaga sp. Cy-1792]
MKYLFMLVMTCYPSFAYSQSEPHELHTVGIAIGLLGGLYDGFYPIGELKTKGDFGIGAPDKINGELLIFNGKAYQTTSDGKTSELPDNYKVPFAMVNNFRPTIRIRINETISKQELYRRLDSLFPNQNGMYAIHISGKFSYVKSRALPPVATQPPYPDFKTWSKQQQFFEFRQVSGDLVGYRLPAYMDNTNISGYHFHFLSADKKGGGHMVDSELSNVIVELEPLEGYTVKIPDTKGFRQFNFQQGYNTEAKNIDEIYETKH